MWKECVNLRELALWSRSAPSRRSYRGPESHTPITKPCSLDRLLRTGTPTSKDITSHAKLLGWPTILDSGLKASSMHGVQDIGFRLSQLGPKDRSLSLRLVGFHTGQGSIPILAV